MVRLMISLMKKSPKLLVIGDIMIDHYLWGSCSRISPEAPVQIVNIDQESLVLGGAGNVIKNLKSLGAQVDVLSVIGDCKIGNEVKELLNSINVSTKFLLSQKNRTTSKKTRIIATHQQVIRYDQETIAEIDTKSQNFILKTFKENILKYDAILLSDLTQSLIKIANEAGKKILADPKGLDFSKYKGAYLLTPNKKEASEATKINIKDHESLTQAIKIIKSKYKLDIGLITLSEEGVAIYDSQLHIHPTTAREVYDVTGAGDTILAALGFALACQLNIHKAIEFANLAAGVVIGKIGSASTSINEIIEYESTINKSSSHKNIKTIDEISLISEQLKLKGKKIVFTNGCFDLLHAGHIKYLEKAKSFGDILILGLNSDKSVKALKGINRPINDQNDRAVTIAALKMVDYVVIFNENTPYKLIKAIAPFTLVKGGDYKNQKVSGQDLVEEFKLVEFIKGKSSTQTIQKIQQEI